MLPSTRTSRLLGTVALALALTTGAAACGADGGDDDAATTTTEADGTTTTTEDDETTTTTEDEVDTDDLDTDDLDTDDLDTDQEPSGDEQAYVDAIAESFGEDEEFLDAEQSECLAESFVDVIGLDNIQDAGLSPEEFAEGDGSDFPDELGVDEDKANELYDQFGECDIDLVATLTDLYGSMSELTPAQEACVGDVLTDDNLRTSFVADFLGEELDEDPLDEVGSCLGFDDDLEADSGTATAEPVTPPTTR